MWQTPLMLDEFSTELLAGGLYCAASRALTRVWGGARGDEGPLFNMHHLPSAGCRPYPAADFIW
jgi:hypothetical protein